MKNVVAGLAGILLCGLCTVVSQGAEPDERPGRMYRVDIKANHPKAYHPSVGDLVQCYVDFPIVPEQIVDDLRVTIKGESLALVAIVNTSKPKIVGSGQVSAFFVPRQTGPAQVAIVVEIPGQESKEYEMTFLVGIRQAH